MTSRGKNDNQAITSMVGLSGAAVFNDQLKKLRDNPKLKVPFGQAHERFYRVGEGEMAFTMTAGAPQGVGNQHMQVCLNGLVSSEPDLPMQLRDLRKRMRVTGIAQASTDAETPIDLTSPFTVITSGKTDILHTGTDPIKVGDRLTWWFPKEGQQQAPRGVASKQDGKDRQVLSLIRVEDFELKNNLDYFDMISFAKSKEFKNMLEVVAPYFFCLGYNYRDSHPAPDSTTKVFGDNLAALLRTTTTDLTYEAVFITQPAFRRVIVEKVKGELFNTNGGTYLPDFMKETVETLIPLANRAKEMNIGFGKAIAMSNSLPGLYLSAVVSQTPGL